MELQLDGATSEARVLSGSPSQPAGRSEYAGLEKLHLVMGMQCNVACVMCYQTHRTARGSMPAEIYATRLAPVFPHVKIVKLQGGEPTIMKNCREVALILRDHPHVKLCLATNAIHLEGFWREVLLRQGEEVYLSLNAASEAAYDRIVVGGDYPRAVKHIRALAASRVGRKPRLVLQAVVLPENILELADFVRIGSDLGVDCVQFAIDPILSLRGLPPDAVVAEELQRVERVSEETEMPTGGLERFRRRFGLPPTSLPTLRATGTCPLPFTQAIIDNDGGVRPCVSTWITLGNLHRESFAEIWNGAKARHFRERILAGDYADCEPWCPSNLKPARTALLRKYATYAVHRPGYFADKVRTKVRQLRRRADSPG